MAFLDGPLRIIGKLDGLSIYYMKGCDKPVVRSCGGASKEKIKTSEKFELTRQNNSEFSTCSTAASTVTAALHNIAHLADYRIKNGIHTLAAAIKKKDEINKRGQRAPFFSRHKYILNGFNLNKKHPFDSIVSGKIECTIDREAGRAVFNIPELMHNINIFLPWSAPQYRILCGLGVVHDLIQDNGCYKKAGDRVSPELIATEWISVSEACKAQQQIVQLRPPGLIKDTSTLIAHVAVEVYVFFPKSGNVPVRMGSAKIIEVA